MTKKLPENVRRKGNGRFIAEIQINGIRRSATRATAKEAHEAIPGLEEEIRSIIQKQKADAEKAQEKSGIWTLQEALEGCIKSRWADDKAKRHLTTNARQAIAFLGPDTLCSAITTGEMDRWARHLAETPVTCANGNSVLLPPNKNGTINRKLAALSAILRHAHKMGHNPHLIMVPRRKESEGRQCYFSPSFVDEVCSFFLNIEKPLHAFATRLLYELGCRHSELWRVTAKDIDSDNRTVSFWRTKGGKPRTIPLSNAAWEVVEHLLAMYPTGRLFPNGSNGWYRNQWDKARAMLGKEGDPEFVSYGLRHSRATEFVKSGESLEFTGKWLGHSCTKTTQRYAHLYDKDLLSMRERQEKRLALQEKEKQEDAAPVQSVGQSGAVSGEQQTVLALKALLTGNESLRNTLLTLLKEESIFSSTKCVNAEKTLIQ